MVDNPTPAVEVTPEDREAAMQTVPDDGSHSSYMMAEAISGGRADDWPLVQAFARHRIAHSPSRGGEVEKLREAGRLGARDIRNAMHRSLNSGHKQAHMNYGPLTVCLDQIDASLASPLPVNADTPAASEGAVPAGMKPWHGGDSAPADWDEWHPVMFRDRTVRLLLARELLGAWKWGAKPAWFDIIAYTPKPTSDTGTRVEAGEGPEEKIGLIQSAFAQYHAPHFKSAEWLIAEIRNIVSGEAA